jgi:hypothetical protein
MLLVKLSGLNCTLGQWKIKSVKIPSKIRLKKGVEYQIVRQDLIDDDPSCLGICNGLTKTIIIKTGLSDRLTLETLIHELLHAICFEFEVKIPHKLIYALEAPIIKILKLNGWI